MTAGVPERADARANRERLIDAAEAVFAEFGLAAEMKTVAERAGLGVGTIYRNFATKDDLLAAVLDRLVARGITIVAHASSLADPAGAVTAIIHAACEHAEANSGLFHAIFSGGVPPDCMPADRSLELQQLMAGVLERGQASGAFRTDMPAAFLAAFLDAFFMTYLELRRSMPADGIKERLALLFLDAVRPPR